jgi:HAD superfamily hydrolase (TIGR01509 family)
MTVWPYSVAIFDLDGTLFDHYYSLRNAMCAVYSRWSLESLTGCSLEFFIKRHEDALTQAYDLYLNGDISNDSVSKETFRIFFTDLGVNAQLIDAESFAAAFKLEYHRHLRPTPGSVVVLNRLREAGITIAVLTNGPSVQQRQKLLAIDLLPHIDHLFTSEDLGFAKPAQQAFRQVLSRLGVDPQRCLMVGDSLDSDVVAALSVGIHAVLYDPVSMSGEINVGEAIVPRIKHFRELLEKFHIAWREW